MDFTSPTGTEVYATADGIVAVMEKNPDRGFGNMVTLDHGFGYRTLYAHMEGFNVKLGQKRAR